jgi:hypothetical protein
MRHERVRFEHWSSLPVSHEQGRWISRASPSQYSELTSNLKLSLKLRIVLLKQLILLRAAGRNVSKVSSSDDAIHVILHSFKEG